MKNRTLRPGGAGQGRPGRFTTLCYSKHYDTKTRDQVCDKTMLGELNGIVNPTLRERIHRAILRKLINAEVNFGLIAPIKAKLNSKIYE